MASIFGGRKDRYKAAPSPASSPQDSPDQYSTPLKDAPLNGLQARTATYDAPLKASTDAGDAPKLTPSAVPSQTPPMRGNRVSTRLAGDTHKPEFLTGVIATVNELQDVFSQLPKDARLDIDLPQVAVVGSQSSGKSSVLESLVGKDFLPRNKDICTRRPLLLQLQRTQGGDANRAGQEWAEFLHQPGQKYTNFQDVRQEIEAETNRSLGSGHQVSPDPITLKIFSPNVLSMTLVDLPGISKVPVGDQPQNIEDILVAMTRDVILNEACIILAVTPGNADVANSEAIKLAQQVDPEGNRTLGVITKVDIMDEGTDVREYLLGEKAPKLRLGYVAVVNRSQADINSHIPVGAALRAEQEWFESSERGRAAYADIASACCTTRVLAHKVNSLLKSHIQRLIPKLQDDLRSRERRLRAELLSLGAFEIENQDSAAALVRRAVGQFEREFSAAISGDTPGCRNTLHGGARIANQLNMFSDYLRDSLPRLVHYTDIEIFQAVRNVYGVEGQMLMADKAFRHLLPPLVRRLRAPCQEVVSFILQELETIANDCLKRVEALQHFSALRELISEVALMAIKDAEAPTQELVGNLIEMEAGFINTRHPSFIGGQAAFTKAQELTEQQERCNRGRDRGRDRDSTLNRSQENGIRGYPVDDDGINIPKQPSVLRCDAPALKEDKLKVETTRVCLESYAEVVVGNLQDSVPKAIMLKLVNAVKSERLNEYLNTHVNRPDMLDDLVQEDPQKAQARNRCRAQLDVVVKALRVLEAMPDKMRHSTAMMRRSVYM